MHRPAIALLVVVLVTIASTRAHAQPPAHCSRAEAGRWPAIGEPTSGADATPISPAEARAAVRAFRRHWAHVPHADPVLRLFTECMMASDEHFTVRRVTRADLQRTLRGPAVRLVGDPDAVPEVAWAWEIYWGGGSRRLVPSGPVSVFLSAGLRTLLGAVHHLEG